MNPMDTQKTMVGEVLPHMPSGRITTESLRRADVVNAFATAFQMIGGISRLALWADENPGEFYKLHSRLLPSAASNELDRVAEIRVIHSLAPPGYDPHGSHLTLVPTKDNAG